MDSIAKELDKFEKRANLGDMVGDIQNVIDNLKEARSAAESNPSQSRVILTKAQTPATKSFENTNSKLKEVHKSLSGHQKSIKEKFKENSLPFADTDTISSQPLMINRAIAMHLLREGLFDVATTFISEANAKPPSPGAPGPSSDPSSSGPPPTQMEIDDDDEPKPAPSHQLHAIDWNTDFSPNAFKASPLQEQFSEMYSILRELRENHNLAPAIAWARAHSDVLDARGSNLEFDLCRLQYISLFTSALPDAGPLAAVAYARRTFPQFPGRYAAQTRQLLGALAYVPNVRGSPYGALFAAASESNTTAAAAGAFTSEFCALLSLSSASPLLTAATAGAIALPTLQKFDQIQTRHRTSWTTTAELPVEVPLPPAYSFHSVFVCPVSKEQATDDNPPMMMPCGHVVARESLQGMSKGGKFKCPYCPSESTPQDALRLYL